MMADFPFFQGTMYEMVKRAAQQYPESAALCFQGKSTTYAQLIRQIQTCANGLSAVGVKAGDQVSIALPNCPQAVCVLYAVNLIGGIANMIHPLSAPAEIAGSVHQSRFLVTLDVLYEKFSRSLQNGQIQCFILASIKDALPFVKKLCCNLQSGEISDRGNSLPWKTLMKKGDLKINQRPMAADAPAVILQSGGTTGISKGVVLSNLNFNALAQQILLANPAFCSGDTMLAAMPMFHGFGLGICVHGILSYGGRCVLIPRFNPSSYARSLIKYKCNYIAGVPTLFEALLRVKELENADLSTLKGVFCGGDGLTDSLQQRIDKFLKDHKAGVAVREGYGLTETVAACCLMPHNAGPKGTVGIPLAETFIKIVKPDSKQVLPCGEVGEILISGPTVMQGYFNCPAETEKVLQTHSDGRMWLHTGDLGMLDRDGFLTFHGRLKRMIVTSGYNVYPCQVEQVLNTHGKVQTSCVVGIPDAYKMQKVIAFVKLVPKVTADQRTQDELLQYCRERMACYAVPSHIFFREEIPLTSLGKVDYRHLEM